KCASCNLTRLGLAQPLAQIAGAVPVPVSSVLRLLPGRIGTTLGMSASVDEYRDMQAELFTLVERFVVLNETARRMLIANGSPAEKLVLNRLGLSQPSIAAKPSADERPTRAPVTFACVGRLHPSKGLTVLAQAIASIPRHVDFRFEIRGPELDPDSRSYAAEL